MQYSISKFIVIICCILAVGAKGQTGWEWIDKGDFVEAEKAFLSNLKKDSTNRDALKGMIFLSEVKQSSFHYQKYITTYVRNHSEEAFYLLFQRAFQGDDKEIIDNKTFTERAKLHSQINYASDLGDKNKDYGKKLKLYREIIGKYTWALIGPFKNESGSGYIESYPVEQKSFDTSAVFIDETGLQLQWVIPSYSAGTGRIFFDQHLNSSSYRDGTYFANTFINVPSDRTLQLRLDRSSPIKLWFDDDLVFESDEKINANYDNEIITLKVKKGNHRILLKNATNYKAATNFKNLSFWDGLVTYSTRVTVRITNDRGDLMDDITSGMFAPYVPTDYKPEVETYPILSYYKDQSQQQPEELFNYYALCKAYLRTGFYQELEEYFVKLYRKHPASPFHTYLAAKAYAANNKSEKVYPMINKLDLGKAPFFEILYSKHKELDKKNDEEQYLASLDKLLALNPAHYGLNNEYVRYYERKGMEQKKDEFINALIANYPHLKPSFESKLSTYKGKSNYTPEERLKAQKESIKKVKSEYSESDIKAAIKYYKEKDKPTKVIKLYDELIDGMPHIDDFRRDKAEYLLDEKRYQEALLVGLDVLKIAPNEPDNLKLVGDVYRKLKEDSLALVYYKRAIENSITGYEVKGIQEEIEKINGGDPLKKIFDTRSLDEILEQGGWEEFAAGEESVVLAYTKDMVLNDYNVVEVFQQMMVKILTPGGADEWTQYNFKFLGWLQSVKVIKPDGREVIPDHRSGYVVFKELAPGDIIKLEGKATYSINNTFDKEFVHRHYVSFHAPVYYHKFEVALPKGKSLVSVAHNCSNEHSIVEKERFTHFVWEDKFLNALKQEEAVLDNTDRYANIMVSTMQDWSKIVSWYQRKTYKRLDLTYDIKEILDTIIKPEMTDSEKVVSIYDFITKEIKYSHVSFLNSAYVPKFPSNTCSGKIGDCKDVATLMITMLRSLGIPSYYVLVKTSHYHQMDMVPSLEFDHVIVAYELDGKIHYADLTTNFYPFYVLTEIDVNCWALRIKSGETQDFRLPNDYISEKKNKVQIKVEATLHTDRSVDMHVNTTHIGMAGGKIRERLFALPEYKHRSFVLELLGEGVFENLQVEKINFGNEESINEPLESEFVLRSEGFTDKISNLFILRMPYMKAVLPNSAVLTNNRVNRISVLEMLDAQPCEQELRINFPEGYKLTELPRNVKEESQFGVYTVEFSAIRGGLIVKKKQVFYKTVVDVSDFEAFKAYYLKILDHDKMKIAIQKRSS